MSNEIINGVNVAGCCCYENDKCLWTKRYYENNIVPDCEKVKNCYYKQLKRLQAENEQLKALCDTYFTCYRAKHNDIEGNLFSYRKALEEIRGILCKGRTFYDGYFENENLSRTDKAIKVISEVLG